MKNEDITEVLDEFTGADGKQYRFINYIGEKYPFRIEIAHDGDWHLLGGEGEYGLSEFRNKQCAEKYIKICLTQERSNDQIWMEELLV